MSSKGRPSFFWYFATQWMFENPKESPFSNFSALWDCPKISIFLILGFVNLYPIIFSILSDVLSKFDVISELYCVLLRRRWRFEKKSFPWKRPTHILKLCFLSLRYSPDFRRSRLVKIPTSQFDILCSSIPLIGVNPVFIALWGIFPCSLSIHVFL